MRTLGVFMVTFDFFLQFWLYLKWNIQKSQNHKRLKPCIHTKNRLIYYFKKANKIKLKNLNLLVYIFNNFSFFICHDLAAPQILMFRNLHFMLFCWKFSFGVIYSLLDKFGIENLICINKLKEVGTLTLSEGNKLFTRAYIGCIEVFVSL